MLFLIMVSVIHAESKMGLWNFQVKFSEAQVHQGNIYLNIFNLWQVANLVVS